MYIRCIKKRISNAKKKKTGREKDKNQVKDAHIVTW